MIAVYKERCRKVFFGKLAAWDRPRVAVAPMIRFLFVPENRVLSTCGNDQFRITPSADGRYEYNQSRL